MYKKILSPVDGSDTSNSGMHEAIALAKTLNAQLRFLHVIDLYLPMMELNGGFNVKYIDDILRENGNNVLNNAQEAARMAGVQAYSKITETTGQRISKIILQEAEAWSADLIVMGTHGLRGFERIIIGSDAETVVRECSQPVLLVKTTSKLTQN